MSHIFLSYVLKHHLNPYLIISCQKNHGEQDRTYEQSNDGVTEKGTIFEQERFYRYLKHFHSKVAIDVQLPLHYLTFRMDGQFFHLVKSSAPIKHKSFNCLELGYLYSNNERYRTGHSYSTRNGFIGIRVFETLTF